MTGGQLNADVERYRQAAGRDTAPPPIAADPLSGGSSPIEQLARLLGMAANAGDPEDNALNAEEYARRETMTREAAEWFAAQDAAAEEEMATISAQEPSGSAAQQLPQMAAGVAGALGGAMQAIGQIPQQFTQAAQQALQAGMGLFGQNAMLTTAENPGEMGDGGFEETLPLDDVGDGFGDGFGNASEDLGTPDLGAAAGGAMPGGTAAWGFGAAAGVSPLGPPPVPSAPTSPAAAPVSHTVTPASPGPAHSGGVPMSGVPMIPPGAPSGAAGTERDAKTDAKRIAVPAVRNGAAVQGRITVTPPEQAALTRAETKPVATRRIAAPSGP